VDVIVVCNVPRQLLMAPGVDAGIVMVAFSMSARSVPSKPPKMYAVYAVLLPPGAPGGLITMV
jgi:hypothetical protein